MNTPERKKLSRLISHPVVTPVKGMNWSAPPSLIDKQSTPRATNILFDDGEVTVRRGMTSMGTVLGIPMLLYPFKLFSGTTTLVCVSTTDVQKWDTSNEVWDLINTYTTGTITVTESDQTIVGDGTDFTNLKGGDKIKLDAKSTWLTVDTITDETNLETVEIPGAADAGAGGAYTARQVLTGDEDDAVNAVTFTNTMIFTNGKDNIKVWDGANPVADLSGADDYGGNPILANDIGILGERVCLFGTTEGGNPVPQRVRWSKLGDSTVWDPETHSSAGFADLISSPEHIVGAKPLRGNIIVYKKHSATRMKYRGGTDVFDFYTFFPNRGALSGKSVVPLTNEHLVMGDGVLWLYRGGADFEDIGEGVRSALLDHHTVATEGRIHSLYFEPAQMAWLIVPSAGETPRTIWAWHSGYDGWSYLNLEDPSSNFYYAVTAVVQWARTGDMVWDDMDSSLTWDNIPEDLTWHDMSLSEEAPTIILGMADGEIYRMDKWLTDDVTEPVKSTFETPDFVHTDGHIRWMKLEFMAHGNTVGVDYSIDGGIYWKPISTVALDGYRRKYVVWLDIFAERIRFRFSKEGAGERFSLAWYQPWYVLRTNR